MPVLRHTTSNKTSANQPPKKNDEEPEPTDNSSQNWIRMVAFPGFGQVRTRYLTSRRNRQHDMQENSWLTRTFLPLVRDWIRPRDSGDGETGRCFFPNPKITFLFEEPEDLVCQICRLSPLVFQQLPHIHGGLYSDSVPAIMPCGHVAGSQCLDRWLRENDSCPFCRHELVYKQCRHKVPAHYIGREEIFLIPATIPEKGEVPDLCYRCYKVALKKTMDTRFEACKRRFVQARNRFLESNIASDASLLMQRKAELENLMRDEYYFKSTRAFFDYW